MLTQHDPRAEPIPGYRLLDRIGEGGFGEVYKAEAPGGILKAIKFVYGNLDGHDSDEARVRQELKALNRVKTVRHPFILSLERFDVIGGRLMIVMELADCNLWDRFEACRSKGLPGIPRDELLSYLRESAEALDLMNDQYQLQHLDIKPQNIFLVHNHVKVADFGLVKDLEGMRVQATSGVTPVYAAPETFEGLVTRYCDQYSLAIVYQELLTGERPIKGANARQLMMQHLTGVPAVEPLPVEDREAVRRALAKKPEDRYPTCGDFVRALLSNDTRQVPTAQTRCVRLGVSATPASASTNAIFRTQVKIASATVVRPAVARDGVLVPACVLGLGTLGKEVVRRFKLALRRRGGVYPALPHLRCLCIDADPDAVRAAVEDDPEAVLQHDEFLLARLNRPGHYLRPTRGKPSVDSWIDPQLLRRLPREQVTANGLRPLGRLAFFDNYRLVATRLRAELEACSHPSNLTTAQRKTGLALRSGQPRVYVIAGLAGGTGSGMFLDVAYTVRQQLELLGYDTPDVVGVFLLPPVGKRARSAPTALGNAVAALTELNHYSSPATTFSGYYVDDQGAITNTTAPFGRTVLLSLPEGEEPGRADAVFAQAGDFLCRELTTSFGRVADEMRKQGLPEEDPALAARPVLQTFGTYTISVPRRALLRRVVRGLCQRLAQRWHASRFTALPETIQAWVLEQWSARQLGPDAVAGSVRESLTRVLGGEPDALYAAASALKLGGQDMSARAVGAAQAALAYFEQLLGSPEAAAARQRPDLFDALDAAVQEAAAAAGHRLAELCLAALEEPLFRLVGAEETIHRQMIERLEQAVDVQKAACRETAQQTAEVFARIRVLLLNLQKSSLLWWGSKSKAAAELEELLPLYPRLRLESLVHEQALNILRHLHGHFPGRLCEVGCCRVWLTRFVENLLQADIPSPSTDQGPGRHLLPDECRSLEEAADRVLARVTPGELAELDQRVQQAIRKQLRGHVHVCTTGMDFLRGLEAAVREAIEAFVASRLVKANVAELYLKQPIPERAKEDDLARAFECAQPAGGLPDAQETCILAVPPGPAGEQLRELARNAVADVELIAANSGDDIVFYREQSGLALADLPQAGPVAQELYYHLRERDQYPVHSRVDVLDWLLVDRG